MLKAKDKQARRGNWITFAIVLALTLITMVLENVMSPGSLLFTVIKKGAVYSLVAVSMNLLNGFTGLFSLGQAGFMLLGAYAYAIFMIPEAAREGVYYLFGGSSVHFSFQEMFQHLFGASGFGGGLSLVLGVLVAIIFAGLVAALFAYLIGLPVLRLKSDYLAIATLGFAEILRAIFQWQGHQRREHPQGLSDVCRLQHHERFRQGALPPERGHADLACRRVHLHHHPAHQLLLRPRVQGHPRR